MFDNGGIGGEPPTKGTEVVIVVCLVLIAFALILGYFTMTRL